MTRIVLLCEGWRDSAFARGFLQTANVAGAVEPRVNPGGSGYSWVQREFVREVASLRRFSEGRGVLALIDEDGAGAAVRQNEIETELQKRGLPPICAQKGRCLLLPMRNFETWLYWLTAYRKGIPVQVNEFTDYKRGGPPPGMPSIGNADCRPAGETLHTLDHTKMPAGHPPMLKTALADLREFLNAVRR